MIRILESYVIDAGVPWFELWLTGCFVLMLLTIIWEAKR